MMIPFCSDKLSFHLRIRMAGSERGHVAEDKVAGAETAAVSGALLALHDRERAEHVIGGIAVQAVEMEEQCVEPGTTAQAVFLVPAEGCAVVALVARRSRLISFET